MPMEQEVFPMLVWGFSIVIALALLTVIVLRIRVKSYKTAYNLFIVHFILFAVGWVYAFTCDESEFC